MRYFAPHPHLSASDLAYLTGVDHRDRVALVAWHETRIVGVGRFDRLGVGLAHSTAEAAFVVCDEFQGHGLGTVLLAHLIEAAIDRDIRVLEAEVLPQNGRMLTTFEHAGYPLTRRYDQGVVRLALELAQAADDRMAP